MEALAYGLRMTSEFLGDPGRAQPPPAQRDDPGTQDPVSRSVAAAGELVDFPYFLGVFGHTGVKQFRHDLLSFLTRRFVHALMCPAFEERSITACCDEDAPGIVET
jgi:hypothetical protein